MADTEREAFEAWARSDESPDFMSEDLQRYGDSYVRVSVAIGWKAWQASALASRPAEVDEMRKPPRTAEEMIACIGGHYNSMYLKNDPEDVGFSLTVHDLLSAMRDWFEDYEFEDEPSHTTNKEK